MWWARRPRQLRWLRRFAFDAPQLSEWRVWACPDHLDGLQGFGSSESVNGADPTAAYHATDRRISRRSRSSVPPQSPRMR